MSRIGKKELFKTLETAARMACPVLPIQKLEEFTCGKLVGMAMGTGILFKMLRDEGILSDLDYDKLDCLLSNRTLEDVMAERKAQEEMKAQMEALEKGIDLTQEQE